MKYSFRFPAALISLALAISFLVWESPTTQAAFAISPPLVPSHAATCDELIVQGKDEQVVPHPEVDTIVIFNIDTLSLVGPGVDWSFGDGFGSGLCNAIESPENDADDLPAGNYALVIVHQYGVEPYSNCVDASKFNYSGFQLTVCFDGLFLFSIGENTPTGTNVIVSASSNTVVTFAQVTSSGETTATSTSTAPEVPSGFKLGDPPTYYDISTTATFSSSVTICINYNDAGMINEAGLKLLHYQDGAWTDVTTSLSTFFNLICGRTTSLSPFALAEKVTAEYVYNEVKSFHLDSGIERALLAKLDEVIAVGDKENAKNVLGAFVNLVNAQEGKKISTQQAEVLIADATALIDSL